MVLLNLYKSRGSHNCSINYRYGQSCFYRVFHVFILFLVFFIFLFCDPALAGIKHISMHDVSSVEIKMLSVKLNLVEGDKSNSRLLVTLSNKQKEEVIIKHKIINHFMLEALVDPRFDLEGAKINVYESKSGHWDKIYSTGFSQSSHNQTISVNTTHSDIVDNQAIKTSRMGVVASEVGRSGSVCYLRFDESETLWSIAKQYKNDWGTSIYGAVLAIYKNNLTKFKNQNINRLVRGANLTCPSDKLIRTINETGLAREKFNRLSKQ